MTPLPISLPKTRPETVGRPMQILLVEDSLPAARLAMGCLRHSPLRHALTWVRDGAEAMRFLDRRGEYRQAPRPDIVLLDLRLPQVDGQEVLERMRSHEDRPVRELPVVVMTASEDEADQRHAAELDVQAYLPKPLDVGRFLDVVQELKDYWRADMVLPDAECVA